MSAVSADAGTPLVLQLAPLFQLLPSPGAAPVQVLFAPATYGPTYGPPSPTGAAPAGWIESLDVSSIARARLSRPLPVSSDDAPAGSAFRASRETMTPLEAPTEVALSSAAAPATCAAAAEVPVMLP